MAKTKLEIRVKNPIEIYFNKISRYQYWVFTCLFLSKIPLFWHVVSFLFMAPPMDFYCEDSGGKINNSTKNACPCEHPRWDRSVFTATLQTKFNTHCEEKWELGVSHSLLFAGSLLGSLVFGFVSDKIGRLTTFCLCLLILSVFAALLTVMPTIATYSLTRFLQGTGIGGAIVSGYVLCVEYCGVRHREVVSALYHVPLNVGHMTLAGVSYLLRDCDNLMLAISIPVFFFVPMYLCISESPKWLMDSHQIERATAAMERISKFNKTSYGSIKTDIEEYHANRSTTKKAQFWHIFKHKQLVINFACMSAVYFVCGMGYYGVSQFIGQMMGDIHVNVAMSGALLIPGTLLCALLLHILNRKTFLLISNFVAGIFMIIVVVVPSEHTWVRVVMACVCNSAFFTSFIIVFLYGVELFPTTVRNSVLGVLTVMSRAGQIAAPLINNLSEIISGSIFGSLAILGAFLCIPLPETKHTELPSTLHDTKTMRRTADKLETNENTN